jgi:vitamin B12 transporter
MKRLVFLLFSFAALPLPAQSSDPAPPPYAQQILVTASSVPEELSSTPASATVITRQDIDRQKAHDIAEVLRQVPGLLVSRSGASGKATSLFTRGSDSTHTLVLWNGVPINNPYFSGYDWGRFSTAGVERVEVVRGPFSSLYGSDAVAGVVNILTTPAKNFAALDLEGGGRGFRNGSFTGATEVGRLSASGGFERRVDDGWSRNDDFSQNSESAGLHWKSQSGWSAGLDGRHTSYNLGIPFNTDASGSAIVPSLNRRQNGTETQFAVPIRRVFSAGSIKLTLSESRRSDDFRDPDDPFGLVSSATDSRTRRAGLQGELATGGFGKLIAGAESEDSRVDDDSNFGPNLRGQKRRSRSLFIEERISRHFSDAAAGLEVAIGARHDDFHTFGSQLSPRLAVALTEGRLKYRAAYGKAFRAPSVGELYFPFFGNRDLNPERSRSVEGGVDAYLSAKSFVSATYFRNDFSNLIVYDNASSHFGNTGKARTEGVELGFSTPLSAHLSTTINYTRLHTRQAETGQTLLRRPKNSGSLLLDWASGGFRTLASFIYAGSRADILPTFPYSRVDDPAYNTVDLTVSYRVASAEPYLRLENAGGRDYEEVRGFRSPGRRLVIGLRYGR